MSGESKPNDWPSSKFRPKKSRLKWAAFFWRCIGDNFLSSRETAPETKYVIFQGADIAPRFNRLHRLSLRFHLARRTGEVTKVIERGTKSIDTMLYFMLFNIAPTVILLLGVAVVGALTEVLLLRRIYRAPELFQLLATFALVLLVKDAVLWLCDEASAGITGQAISISGGETW